MIQNEISGRIQEFTEAFIVQWPDAFLVDVQVTTGKNKVTILLDADHGINIDRCATVNKALVKWIEEKKIFGSANYTTEVSSPGIDRPLKLLRQFLKNVGRTVQVQMAEGTGQVGKLTAVTENDISLQLESKTKNKQTEVKTITIPFAQIKQVKVVVTF